MVHQALTVAADVAGARARPADCEQARLAPAPHLEFTSARGARYAAADCRRDDSAVSRSVAFVASVAPCMMLCPSSLV